MSKRTFTTSGSLETTPFIPRTDTTSPTTKRATMYENAERTERTEEQAVTVKETPKKETVYSSVMIYAEDKIRADAEREKYPKLSQVVYFEAAIRAFNNIRAKARVESSPLGGKYPEAGE